MSDENTHLAMLYDDVTDLKRMLAEATSDYDREHYRALLASTEAELKRLQPKRRLLSTV